MAHRIALRDAGIESEDRYAMGWLLFESFVALIVVVAIVWWTMRPVHRRDRAHAARRAHDEVTADDRARAPDTAGAAGRRDEHRP